MPRISTEIGWTWNFTLTKPKSQYLAIENVSRAISHTSDRDFCCFPYEINRIHHWCPVGTEKSQSEGPLFQWETRLAEFPTERWTRWFGFFWNHWTPMMDSFSRIPILNLATVQYGTVQYNICWWRHWGRCLQSMTRAVQLKLKQQINSALNNERTVISSNVFTRTNLSATVIWVSNFVEENVFLFLHRQGSPSWCIQTQSVIAQRASNMSQYTQHVQSFYVLLYTKLKADLNCWNFNIDIFPDCQQFNFHFRRNTVIGQNVVCVCVCVFSH